MIVDLAVLRFCKHRSSSHPNGLDGILVFHRPRTNIEEVDVLLDVEVARQPGKVVPVPHLVQHVGPVGLARLGPATAAVVVGEERLHRTDRPVVDAPYRLPKAVVVADAEAGHDRQPFFLGQLATRQHRLDARGIDGHRLLREHVLACVDSLPEVLRAEVRRRAEQDHVDAAIQEFTVGVESDETMVGPDIKFGGRLLVFRRVFRLCSRRSSKASAMATSLTFVSAPSAWTAAPVPRSPQPIKPTRSTSLPAACAFVIAAIVPVAAAVFKKIRRELDAEIMCRASFTSAVDAIQTFATNNSNPSHCKQDLAGRGEHVVALVDSDPVDLNRDTVACAQAIDSSPLTHWAFDVVLASSVEQLLKIRIVPRPPKLAVGEDPRLTPFQPPRPLVWPQDCLARERNGDRLAVRVRASNGDQVADTTLGELALDRRHPLAAGAAIRPDRV